MKHLMMRRRGACGSCLSLDWGGGRPLLLLLLLLVALSWLAGL